MPDDIDDVQPVEEAASLRSRRQPALRWVGIGIFVMLAGGVATVLLRHYLGNDGDTPALLRVGPPIVALGAILLGWGIVAWVRAK